MRSVRKRFCKRGHDTSVVSRTSSGDCSECNKIRIRSREVANRERDRVMTRNWDHANLLHCRALSRAWAMKNLTKTRAASRKNELKRLHRVPKFGQEGIPELYFNCPDGMVVDHIIPVCGKIVSGLHVIWNLQYLTVKQNLEKGNRFEEVSSGR